MQDDRSNNRDNLQDESTRLNNNMKEDISNYIDKRLELFKLTAYEKLAQSSSYILFGLIILLLVCVIFLLSLLGLAFFIGSYFDSLGLGFGILVVITLLIMAVFIAFGKQFRRSSVNLVIKILRKIEMDEE